MKEIEITGFTNVTSDYRKVLDIFFWDCSLLAFFGAFSWKFIKTKKRAKSKRLKHITFSTCSIILFISVKQLTLAFDDHDRNQKKWQQNQRNLHDFEITLKKKSKFDYYMARSLSSMPIL